MRKLFCLLMVVVLILTTGGLFACSGDEKDPSKSGTTTLSISFHDDSIGGKWMEDVITRFEAKYANKSYATGKTGVEVDMDTSSGELSTISTDGTAIYFRNRDNTIESYVRNNSFLNISDIVTDTTNGSSIESRMQDKESYKVNGNYYALPDAEYYACVSYDKDLFDELGLYFSTGVGEKFDSNITEETYYFTKVKADKTCGPDGETGTIDDGLPSSIFELAALCEFMKTKNVAPFSLAYNQNLDEYANFLMDALMASLQGNKAKTMYSLDDEEFEIITGWTNDNLFPGVSSIKKPITKKIPITEETGYYTTWSVDKFYAEAFVQLIIEKGWFAEKTTQKNADHIEAQKRFVFSGADNFEQVGMLVEATYWYNEATNRNTFINYFNYVGQSKSERNICLMSLPINFNESVTEGNGEEPTYLCTSRSFVCVNANIANNDEIKEAVKDFLQFIYSPDELSFATVKQGLPRNMNYTIKPTHEGLFTAYGKSVWELFNSANIVRFEGTTNTFKYNQSLFNRGFEDGSFVISGYKSCFKPMMDNGKTAKECFEAQMKVKSDWTSMYRGTGTVSDFEGTVYTK